MIDKQNILQNLMCVAIEEARTSLREGNSGFGAVIAKDDKIIVQTHDTDNTDNDPTAHAEIKAIKAASAQLGKNLKGCLLVSTHEPCPMCSTAIFWSGIEEIGFGYSIKEAIKQGRKRIDLPLRDIFSLGEKHIQIHESILSDQCSILYNRAVRNDICMLRNADADVLTKFAGEKSRSRLEWYKEVYSSKMTPSLSIIDAAYQLFLTRLNITAEDAPIIRRTNNFVIIHSKNFCPTLEACKILNIDTRLVCRCLTENPTTELLRQLHPKLRFYRNYEKLRPYTEFCEEMIVLEE